MQALLAFVVSTAALGIDVGWQPSDEGGLEYIIQIEPDLLAKLKPGDEIIGGVRPTLQQDVRRYRIVVGNSTLPRVGQVEKSVLVPSRAGGDIASETHPTPEPLSSERSVLVAKSPTTSPAWTLPAPPPQVAIKEPAAKPFVPLNDSWTPPLATTFEQHGPPVPPGFRERMARGAELPSAGALADRFDLRPPAVVEKTATIPVPTAPRADTRYGYDTRYGAPSKASDAKLEFRPTVSTASSNLTKAVVAPPTAKWPTEKAPGPLPIDPSVKPVSNEYPEVDRHAPRATLTAHDCAALSRPVDMKTSSPEVKPALETRPQPAAAPAPAEAPRPWLALTFALFALFASLGGNVFLGWVAHDSRTRYRRVVDNRGPSASAARAA